MSCEKKYKLEKKEIRGGNKKKLISNLQKRKKSCDLSSIEEETNVWNRCNNQELLEKLYKINLSAIKDKKLIRLIRTLQQTSSYWSEKRKIKNYVTQELVFQVFEKLDIYIEFDEDKDYIKKMNYLLFEYKY